VVEKLYAAWGRMMPRVHPCYAVKCNPDEGLLATLAALGAGFDCASEAELAAVMALGVGPERLVYAHPCKPPKQIRWAASNGVDLTTFDTESELIKVGGTGCCLPACLPACLMTGLRSVHVLLADCVVCMRPADSVQPLCSGRRASAHVTGIGECAGC
jgi:ornithine decarboxylase